MTAALKPYPFCGGDAANGTVRYSKSTIREQLWRQDTFHFINCVACGASNKGLTGHNTPDAAAAAWNRRTHEVIALEPQP